MTVLKLIGYTVNSVVKHTGVLYSELSFEADSVQFILLGNIFCAANSVKKHI